MQAPVESDCEGARSGLPGLHHRERTRAMSASVLLIEDDRDISTSVQAALKAAGYEVRAASNGQEGKKLLAEQRPDLVVTDMMMPRMGGFPVLEHLREMSDPPRVIMITANEGGRHKAYAEMLGVDDYIRKPFAMEALVESVKRVLADADSSSA